jgi:hypothetical protein
LAYTLSPMEDIRDIKGIISPDRGLTVLWAAILLAVLILLSLFVSIRKRRNKTKLLSPLSPHEVAWEALQDLRRKDLVREGKIKDLYLELAGIIRRYLDDKYGWKTSQMTTDECLFRLETIEGLPPEQKDLLKEFMKDCDRVKFARYRPTSEESERNFWNAQEIVLRQGK